MDPYLKGFGNIVLKLDKNNSTEIELEEAYGLTTSLPHNLQLKFGQFFPDFGRQNAQHPHSWAFVDVPLVLAGHTHCGQVVFPLIGPLLSRSPREHWRRLYNPRYRCGLVRDPGRVVIVTAGVGSGTTPIRLGAPPDWWLVAIGPKL